MEDQNEQNDNLNSSDEPPRKAEAAESTTSERSEDDHTPEPASPAPEASAKEPNKLKHLLNNYWHHKKWTLPLTIIVLLGIIAGVPWTRYAVAGLVLKQDYTVSVTDATTHQPVTSATVDLAGVSGKTNNQGAITVHARVGTRTLTVSKKYYKTSATSVLIPIMKQRSTQHIELQATGRQVPTKVIDKVSGKPIANATVKAQGTETKTDASGKAIIVLPANSTAQTATIQAAGYNDLSSQVQVTAKEVTANTFNLIPAGRIYFLSNQSGKIDVVSTNLDGTDRKVVLAGTGNEEPYSTALLATRDWKYLALLSKRAGGDHAKLYLINTSNDQTTTMDEGTADFNLVGWSGHYFVYRVDRTNVKTWENGQHALKTFNADTAKITLIDQTTAEGVENNYVYKNFGFIDLVGDRVVYNFTWDSNGYSATVNGKNDSIISAAADGTSKKDLRDIPRNGNSYNFMTSVLYKPEILYIQDYIYNSGDSSVYYTYNGENNTVTQSSTLTAAAFTQAQQTPNTYLISPSSKASFWSEERDGKNSLFVGDYEGDNAKQIASLSDYAPYGWYTDNYLLVQKKGSELYIIPASGGTGLKISDYYKVPQVFPGYGGGYGGL